VAFEGLCEIECIGGVAFHPDVEGFEASAEDPGVEGRKRGAGAAAEEVDFLYQFFSSQDGAAEDAALAVDPFCGGVDDEIGAEVDRRLADGGSEAVVYIEQQVVFFGDGSGGGEVNDVETGVGGSLEEDHFGVGTDSGFPGGGVGIDVGVFDAVFREVFGDDRMGAAEDGVAG